MKLIVFDGWEVMIFSVVIIIAAWALCERSARKSAEEVERIYESVVEKMIRKLEVKETHERVNR